MQYWKQGRQGLGLVIVLALGVWMGTPVAAQNEKKDNTKKVPITTSDGVELQGTLWPNASGKRDACVLLLHNFDRNKGGGRNQDGWDDLAESLQKEGYTVFSFDFRGFGDSRTVNKSFWSKPHNITLKNAKKMPETVDHKEFPPGYYINFVNDIAAVKSYLDRQNDLKVLNSSNLIVIGAGDGATLGALWMATEFKRARAAGGFVGPAGLDDPEGKDLICGVWLGISPTLAGNRVPALHNSLSDVAGRKHKVPMLFVYGKDDKSAESVALGHLKNFVPNFVQGQAPKDKAFQFTRDWAVKNTKLTGSQLLNNSLETPEIIKFYLNDNMQKRGAREARNKDYLKSAYFWTLPGGRTIQAKSAGEDTTRTMPLRDLGLAR